MYPIIFETENKNRYVYDNGTRIVIPVNNYVPELRKDQVVLDNDEILNKIRKDYSRIPLFEAMSMETLQNKVLDNTKRYLE